MEVKERVDILITPVVLKFGLAVAFSLGGALYIYLRTGRIDSPGNDSTQADSRDDDHALQNSTSSTTDHSSSGDKDSFTLPEFADLKTVLTDNVCPSPVHDVEYKFIECDEHKKEIKRLQEKVKILQEKEGNLELQLLEYYGIKEQETAVMELQRQLKLNTAEAKLYNLKIESLLSDNRRLVAQVADYVNAANELESAKAKIKILRMKLKLEVERNREQLLKLQGRVMNLQEEESKASEMDEERERLKTKLEEMRICNQVLKQENSDLAQKLDYVKMLAPNALNDEVLELKEESRRLKQQNEESRKKIEILQDDRSRDLEELVYLRWIKACLRHELRSYHPEGRKSIANLSPRLADYSNNEGPANYLDSEQWSPSQASSCITDDLPVSSNKPSKEKFFAKLRRLLRGKSNSTQTTPGPGQPLERTVSGDNIPGRLSCEFPSESDNAMKALRSLSRSSSRRSFDIPRSYSRRAKSIEGGSSCNCSRTNDDDASSVLTRIESASGYDNNWSPGGFQGVDDQDSQNAAKDIDLLKFAEALKNCRPKSSRSSISYESS